VDSKLRAADRKALSVTTSTSIIYSIKTMLMHMEAKAKILQPSPLLSS
jgi:hypothetical protein